MKDRLTSKFNNDTNAVSNRFITPFNFNDNIYYYGEAINKLSAYEDTGLSPEEVAELKDRLEVVRKRLDTESYMKASAFEKLAEMKKRVEIVEKALHMACVDMICNEYVEDGKDCNGANVCGMDCNRFKNTIEHYKKEAEKEIENDER